MTDDTPKEILKIDDATSRQLKTLAKQIAQWQADPAIRRILSEYTRTQDVLRAALGPLEDVRRQVLSAASAVHGSYVSPARRQTSINWHSSVPLNGLDGHPATSRAD